MNKKFIHSKGKSRDIFKGANDIIVVIDQEERIIDVNDRVTMISKCKKKELIGKKLEELGNFFKEDDLKELLRKFRRRIKERDNSTFEGMALDKEGEEVALEISLSRIKIGGKIIRYLAILRDISARKKMEDDLEQSLMILKEQKEELELNAIGMREVIKQIEIEKDFVKEKVAANIKNVIYPILKKLRGKGSKLDKKYIGLIEQHLEEMTTSFGQEISDRTHSLTQREIEISSLIRSGMSSKEIAGMLYISLKTVDNHRDKIREKLGIKNQAVRLSSYLREMGI